MKIACYSLVLGRGYTVPAAIELLARLGYDGVEWRVRNDFHLPLNGLAEKAEEIKTLCQQAGLAIPILSTYLPLQEVSAIATVLSSAAAIGCPMVRVAAPAYDGTVAYPELLAQACGQLAQLEPLCRQTGVKVTVAMHMNNIAPSASAALRLVEGFDPACIGVVLDPGNMACEGRENWLMGLQILGPYLAHVHVKNGGWFYSDEEGWRFGWLPLTEGLVNWGEVLALLTRVGYGGWLSVEDFADELPVEERLGQDIALLRQYLAEAGPSGA